MQREKEINPQKKFWDQLNPRPSEYQSDALTTKPQGHRERISCNLAEASTQWCYMHLVSCSSTVGPMA